VGGRASPGGFAIPQMAKRLPEAVILEDQALLICKGQVMPSVKPQNLKPILRQSKIDRPPRGRLRSHHPI